MAGFGAYALCPFLVVTLIGAGCGAHSVRSFHFDYNNRGEDWLDGECASRDRQSPIDFDVHAPWQCNPTDLELYRALPLLIGFENLFKLGFSKFAGLGSPAPAPMLTVAAAPGSEAAMLDMTDSWNPTASMLQTASENYDGFWPGGMFAPTRPPIPTAPPQLMLTGCSGPLGAFFFKYDYLEKPMVMQNNGHSIVVDLKGHGLGGITMDNTAFDVLSVNFHVWSEHTFNGEKKPLELHIVHREPETNHILIAAVLFDTPGGTPQSKLGLLQTGKRNRRLRAQGSKQIPVDINAQTPGAPPSIQIVVGNKSLREAHRARSKVPREPQPTDPGFSHALANLMTYPLPAVDEIKTVGLRAGPVDLIEPLLKGDRPEAFFQYRGSLTAPPCTEQVTWLVRKEPLLASESQIELLRFHIMKANSNHPNARSTMPLMGRNILYKLAINGDPPRSQEEVPTAIPQPGANDRHIDFRGVIEGKEAYQMAMRAQGFRDRIVGAIKQAQSIRAASQAAIDPAIAAQAQGYVAAAQSIITTPMPTPDPDMVLKRMVDAVADDLDGAEKAAALAAAGVMAPAVLAPAAPPAPR